MITKYKIESEGQRDFYISYLSRIDNSLSLEEIIADNNDGVLKGNIIEFKTNIIDLNAVLFQTIKYLSSRRIKGKPVPKNIILISLNDGTAYVYDSEDFLEQIEIPYVGAASKDNIGFQGKAPLLRLNYIEDIIHESKLIEILRTDNFTKINIDENCIVGWAKTFYSQNPHARKADFLGDSGKVKIIGEIRNPNKFKDYINPYKGESNVKFNYLMDKLNDEIQKKNLGAFYTPDLYCLKSLELVREAIKRVPNGNDFVIIDRCAGTGNLEREMTKEELSHTILSTYEYYEYKVLMELLGDKVRHIIPPTEKEDTFNMGLVKGADALSKEYINNPLIRKYIEDINTTIILFENPPYAETTSIEHQKKKIAAKSSTWKISYVLKQMAKEVKGAARNDLGNAFIWSAFEYYLRQPTDSYIVFSPVKYWKVHGLINKKFIKGFAFNRKHFHTNIDACIMCALWSNENGMNNDCLKIDAYDIVNNELFGEGSLDVRKIYTTYSGVYYDKRKFQNDSNIGVLAGLNGFEEKGNVKRRILPVNNNNVIGYLVVDSSGFDNPDLHSSLLVAGRYNGNGFYLRRDNYLEKLPMFASSRYIAYNKKWTERARIMKSADGNICFDNDVREGILDEFLLKVLFFTVFENQNHMASFWGSDGNYYRNELCLDTTNGETIASRALKNMHFNQTEKDLLSRWERTLLYAKNTENYNSELTYGLYQITYELNTFTYDEETDTNTPDYPDLNGELKGFKSQLKDYYNKEIVPNLFKYEFLK